jgi:hypothetical protein
MKAADGPDPAILHLTLKEVDVSALDGLAAFKADQLRVDLFGVDASFLSSDPAGRVRQLREEYVRAGVVDSVEDAPRLFVIAHEGSGVRPENFRIEGIEHFAWKTHERRYLLENFMTLVKPELRRDAAVVPRRVSCRMPSHLARDTHFDEISEFGIAIRTQGPLRAGSILRFFSPVLGRLEHGVLARCVSAREADGGWSNEFVFYGSSDEFQKRIRTYVRQEHARRKAKEAAS